MTETKNNSIQITCCQLTLLSSGIHDYAQMKKVENASFKQNQKWNPEKLTIWQLGIFEDQVLLLEALKKDNKLCEKCLNYRNQILAIRQAWESKIV